MQVATGMSTTMVFGVCSGAALVAGEMGVGEGEETDVGWEVGVMAVGPGVGARAGAVAGEEIGDGRVAGPWDAGAGAGTVAEVVLLVAEGVGNGIDMESAWPQPHLQSHSEMSH